jgi:hypothetical protein
MSTYTITPFHDGKSNMCALYEKFHECKLISQIIGEGADGKDIHICIYWDNVEQKALVSHNKHYVYVTNGNSQISVNNILDAFGLSYLDANVIKPLTDMKTDSPNKMLDMPLLETSISLVEVIPNIHNREEDRETLCEKRCETLCGDGIDSDDYDSD